MAGSTHVGSPLGVATDHMVIVVIVPFLNEEAHLPSLLESLEGQTRAPDHLVLVDDGSTDGSPAMAKNFAARHPYARTLHRPQQPRTRDRLKSASELGAWRWGLESTGLDGDLLVKLDADLRLPSRIFEEMEQHFRADPGLGLAGAHLSVIGPDGVPVREINRQGHVRGPNKFYRRECYRQISPIPQILGWDTIDEMAARMHGWRTSSFAISDGDPVHLRHTGTYDGILRGYRRMGRAAYGYGAHPLHVLAGAVRRVVEPPYVLTGLSYLAGWLGAWLSRAPRADPELRAYVRRIQLEPVRRLLPQTAGR